MDQLLLLLFDENMTEGPQSVKLTLTLNSIVLELKSLKNFSLLFSNAEPASSPLSPRRLTLTKVFIFLNTIMVTILYLPPIQGSKALHWKLVSSVFDTRES